VAKASGVAIAKVVSFWGERAGTGETFPVVAAVGPGVTAVPCAVTWLAGVATVVWTAVWTVLTGLATTTGVVETFTGAFVATCSAANPRKNPYPVASRSGVWLLSPPARQGGTRRAQTSSAAAIIRTRAGRQKASCPVGNLFMDEPIIVN
jgi:hypothetical protein